MLLFAVTILSSMVSFAKSKIFGDSTSPKFTEQRQKNDENAAKTLEDFGYEFTENGELRSIDSGEKFKFEVKAGNRAYNQKHYEALGDVITEEVYKLLEAKSGLKRIKTPHNAHRTEATGFFFASDDFQTNERLLILIHGSGAVRAGQWSRRLIINDNLKTGTQLPYVENAKSAGFAVVVLNTNQNKMFNVKGDDVYIRENEDPVSHALHVWDNFIKPSNAKYIAIVAHSAGGYVTVKLTLERSQEFVKRVFAVAFTDSAHASPSRQTDGWKHLMRVGQNWVTSREPLNTVLPQYRDEIYRVSAGTISHEETSSKAIDKVYAYIQSKLNELTRKPVVSREEQEEEDEDEKTADDSVEIVAEIKNNEVVISEDDGAQQKQQLTQIVNGSANDDNKKEEQELLASNGAEEEKPTGDQQQPITDGHVINVAKKKKHHDDVEDKDEQVGTEKNAEEPQIKRGKIEL